MVQRMLVGGRELIVGGRRDPSFGPLVLLGLGGVAVELLDDVSLRLAPLTQAEALAMIEELRGARLLHGARGGPALDVQAVAKTLVALGRLLGECPEVKEIELNPLLVFEQGALAVDGRAMVEVGGDRTVLSPPE